MFSPSSELPVFRPYLKVLERSVYRGPHYYSHIPMIRIQLDLGKLEEFPTSKLPWLTRELLACLPGLQNHGCSYGEPGGLIRRMEEGTWLGHVIEHVALELQSIAGSRVTRGKTRSVKGSPGVYNILYAYNEESVGLMAGRIAIELVNEKLPEILKGVEGLDKIWKESEWCSPFRLEEAISKLSERVRADALGPTTASIVREAEERDIPWMRLDDESNLIQFGYGKNQKRIRASVTGHTSEVAAEIAGDKDLTKKLLRAAGIPVPQGGYCQTLEGAVQEAERIGFPVVIKPLDGNHGRGVTTNICNKERMAEAFRLAQEHSRSVIVEKQFEGHDHRILVVGGKVVAVAKREPAHVVGDGVRTIEALIEDANKDPKRGEGHENYLTKITVNECLISFLGRSGRSLQSVPQASEKVQLLPTANLSTGGTATDLTDAIHPYNRLAAERAARAVGLDIAGIDFITEDISRSVEEAGGGVIEVNAAPGFRMHLQPSLGRARNVARPVMDMLFPKGAESRIPIFAITGTNGKSTTCRMLAHILKESGLAVGLATSSGVFLNGQRIVEADASGPKSARMVLSDPSVEAAVLETARGGILREGLGYGACDVGAVLNIAEDHLGLKGIDTLEDLAAVKSVVVETVHSKGTSVLNADDPFSYSLRKHAGGRVAYFSASEPADRPEFLSKHIEDGGLAVVRDPSPIGGEIVIYDRGESFLVMNVEDIPATQRGIADFNVENALAATAMAFAHGVEINHIRAGLAGFTTSFEHSPGRLNIYDGHPFRVILDYAHNPHGLNALGKVVEKMRNDQRRTIGVIGIAGDRRNSDIHKMGALSAEIFDSIIFREDGDRRGRQPGEIAALLKEGALQNGFSPTHVRCILSEPDAIDFALRAAGPNDMVVITVEDARKAWQQVTNFEPEDHAEDAYSLEVDTQISRAG